jgi:hypothetical protein
VRGDFLIKLRNMEEKKEILNKEIAEKLMKIEGESRGMSLRGDIAYIMAKKGEAGLKKWKEELEKVGCPMKYEKIKTLGLYPVGWRATSLLVMKKVFGWGDEEFRDLGRFEFSVGMPSTVRIFIKFFHSIEAIVRRASQIYKKYFTKGELSIPDFSPTEKYIIVRIKGLDLIPEFCRVLEGYFENTMKTISRIKGVECHETKCTFRGDEYHEFLIKW